MRQKKLWDEAEGFLNRDTKVPQQYLIRTFTKTTTSRGHLDLKT